MVSSPCLGCNSLLLLLYLQNRRPPLFLQQRAIYAIPRGALRKELIACLRQSRKSRRPRTRGEDRRGSIPNMVSIHDRPTDIEERIIPGHWKGDLIKGARNASSVGTLVERTSLFVTLVKLDSATAKSVEQGFAHVLNRVDAQKRLSMTYDQGREMAWHELLATETKIKVYFADPHSLWQRGRNENNNGLLRQYLPKGTDLSIYSQQELDAIVRINPVFFIVATLLFIHVAR